MNIYIYIYIQREREREIERDREIELEIDIEIKVGMAMGMDMGIEIEIESFPSVSPQNWIPLPLCDEQGSPFNPCSQRRRESYVLECRTQP